LPVAAVGEPLDPRAFGLSREAAAVNAIGTYIDYPFHPGSMKSD
jgi:hypothetical protein